MMENLFILFWKAKTNILKNFSQFFISYDEFVVIFIGK